MIRCWKETGTMLIVLLALLVPLLHFSPQASAAVVSPDGWGWKNLLPQGNRLSGVWGTSASNVYAVGDAGTILHYGGTTWDSMDSGTSNNLYSVWGSSATDIYAVGAGGIVLHYGGGNWTSVTPTSHDLYAVWGSSSSDIFAVGDAGTILHYSGSNWTSTITGLTTPLNGVWGSSSSDVYAVGDGGTILHFTTNTWSSITISPNNLRGVWGNSSDVYAVGDGGTILHFTAGTWTSMPSGTTNPLSAVWGTSPSDIYAAGDGGTILHYNATLWSPMISNTSNNLKAVWGSSSYAFGVGEAGTILHYSSGTWDSRTVGMTNNLKAVWGSSSSDVFAVGDAGTILHYNGSTWSSTITGSNLRGAWGSSSSDVFAVGDGGIILHYTAGTWSSITTGINLKGVWGSSAIDVYAAGDMGTIFHYNGSNWTPMSSGTTEDLSAVWGTSSSEVFAVGVSGTVLKYNGSTWTPMSSGTMEDLYGVWGTSSTNVFAVGNGIIRQYDGSSWSSMSGASGKYLRNIWGTGSSDSYTAYAVGLGGVILQYTSGAWKSLNSGTAYELSGVWGSSSSDVFAVGRNGTILHYRDLPSPTLNQVTPPQGIQGQSPLDVTINGTYLDGTTAANFGQGITVNTPTVSPSGTQVTAQITIASDAVLGPRDVSVTTNLGTATMKAAFTVLPPPPAIASFTPIQGAQGQQLDVTIIGINLGGATAASFGQGITVNSIGLNSGTQITVNITIAADATLGPRDLSVTTPGGTSTPLLGAFAVIQPPQPPPTLSQVSPKEAAPAQSLDLTILGTNLGNTAAVVFGNGITVNRIGLNSGTQITANVTIAADATPGARDVTVYTPGGTFTLPSGFTVSQSPSNEPTFTPVVLSVSPNQGVQGETLNVTITGANLSGVTALAFGDGIVVNSIGINSATEITANITIADVATPGARTVSSTNPPGGKLADSFTVIDSSQANGNSEQKDGQAKGSESGGHGVHAWVWVLVALAVLVFAGSVVFIIRLRREIAD